jgi:hypothetical protein
MTPRHERAFDALGLVALKLALGAWVLHTGFSHVSDDDYSRTAIAEAFAHAPRLDPSGTSWLPFPFWIEGFSMMAAGRSLAVARAVAVALGAATAIAPYLASRVAGMSRGAALIASIVAMSFPYGAWLGVATVPEGWAGAVTAAALIGMGQARLRPWCAAALLAASLSRYEAWAACAVFAAFCTMQGARRSPGTTPVIEAACVLGATAGPLAWMAWNAHAHGSPLHFLARVATFRQAAGLASVPLADKLLGYPRALLTDTAEAGFLGLAGLLGIAASPSLRKRWAWVAVAAGAILAFLVAGDLGDGAPTHHPARALSAVWWLTAAMGVDTLAAGAARLEGRPQVAARALGGALVLAWLALLPGRLRDAPGETDSERRDAQIARGLSMRARSVGAVEITPCAFEHFALLAAWGAPERASIHARTGAPVTDACPLVEERLPNADAQNPN